MKTINEIHRDNLQELVNEAGGVQSLANKLNKSAAQVSQWLNGAKDSKTGKPRGISDDAARQIEIKMDKEHGWLDHDHSDKGLEQFRKLPPEVRSWLMHQSDHND